MPNDKTCHIVGAGDPICLNIDKKDNDIIIACDGGLKYLNSVNVVPDIIIGDFDSLGFVPDGEKVIVLPVEKDLTDVGAAIEYALNLGFDSFKLYCCTGGRLSHTLANIQLAVNLSRLSKKVFIYGKETVAAITDSTFTMPISRGTVSIFSSGNAEGVTLNGFKYPLKNYSMTDSFPIGVSNEIMEDSATVTVKKGTLIILF